MAGEPFISVAYDSVSLADILRLGQFNDVLEPKIANGLAEIGDLVVSDAVSNTWIEFENPTGQLASSIFWMFSGPMEIMLIVDEPYAWRMEEGFYGADSLGRVYAEPGKPYAMPAVLNNQDQILQIMSQATGEIFGDYIEVQ